MYTHHTLTHVHTHHTHMYTHTTHAHTCTYTPHTHTHVHTHHTLTHVHTHHTAKRKPGMSPQMLKRVTLWESQSTLTTTVVPSPLTSTPHTSTNGRREDEGARAVPEIKRYPFQPRTIPQVRVEEGGGGRASRRGGNVCSTEGHLLVILVGVNHV